MPLQILIRNRATDLDARMHDGTTPLILAARLAVDGMVEELINCHADANATDDSGSSRFYQLIISTVHKDPCGLGCYDNQPSPLSLSVQVNLLSTGLQL